MAVKESLRFVYDEEDLEEAEAVKGNNKMVVEAEAVEVGTQEDAMSDD